MVHKTKFYGTIYIPKEKVKEFLDLKIRSELEIGKEFKVVIKQTRKFKYYKIKCFLQGTNKDYSSIEYCTFIENVYGDLFLHRLDRTLGANMLYELIKLGFIFDYTDMKQYKKELKKLEGANNGK